MNCKRGVLKHLTQDNNHLSPIIHSKIFLHASHALPSVIKLGFAVRSSRHGFLPVWNLPGKLWTKISVFVAFL